MKFWRVVSFPYSYGSEGHILCGKGARLSCPFRDQILCVQRNYLQSSIFWDITTCSPLKVNQVVHHRCKNLTSYNIITYFPKAPLTKSCKGFRYIHTENVILSSTVYFDTVQSHD
jgi:hypothetical protein